jgi:hypothetical protein
LSGADALRQIEAAAQREVVLNAELVARALSVSRKQLLRDWKSRGLPLVRVGYTTLLPVDDVCRAYFAHLTTDLPSITAGISVTVSHSVQTGPIPDVILGPARTTFSRSSAHV